MVNFEMIGKISMPKESEKFKNYEEVEYKSGWINRTLKFNLISEDNRFMLQSKGGCFKDGHGDLYLFGKDYTKDDGTKVKGSAYTIPFKDRFDEDKIAECADFKKFVCDLEQPGRRWKLQNAADKLKYGYEFTDDELKVLGVANSNEIAAELEKSKKKHKEFLSAYDYAEFLHKVFTSDKYKNKKFRIRGNYEMQYSDEKQRWYNNYVPNRIYLMDDDAEEMATASLVLLYDENSLDSMSAEETGKYYVNGYVEVYDNNRKANIFAPYTVVVADNSEKKVKKLVDMFTVEDGVKQLGMVVDLLDGAQKTEIKLEDLDEETQDNILCGLVDFEDVKRELGGSTYGERVTENRFKKLGRGYAAGSQDTVYASEDLVIKPLGSDEEESVDLFAEEDDEDMDLFN